MELFNVKAILFFIRKKSVRENFFLLFQVSSKYEKNKKKKKY